MNPTALLPYCQLPVLGVATRGATARGLPGLQSTAGRWVTAALLLFRLLAVQVSLS